MNNFRFWPTALFLWLAGSLSAQTSSAFYPEEMVVIASSLNLREDADINAKKIANLPRGSVVEFIEAWNGGELIELDSLTWGSWYKVRYEGKTGYAFSTYLANTFSLFFENTYMEEVPPMLWYGVYARDSFSDELRSINVKVQDQFNEMFGEYIKVLKTNQKQESKFIIGTLTPLKTGFVGQLGLFDPKTLFFTAALQPGTQVSIYPGNEPNDTITRPTWGLAATGCATLDKAYVMVKDYRLTLLDYSTDPLQTQDLTPWVRPEISDANPSVDLLWFGDLDQDGAPDAILQDCPYEVGCRASLFLSSKARPGEYIRKVSEYFWPDH